MIDCVGTTTSQQHHESRQTSDVLSTFFLHNNTRKHKDSETSPIPMHYGWSTIVVANVLVAVYRALPAKLRLLGWPSIGWQDAMQVRIVLRTSNQTLKLEGSRLLESISLE